MTADIEGTVKIDLEKDKNNINRYVTFTIANEDYGVPLNYIKEIIAITEVTPVPKLPNFFKGVINVRGKIISVIDLCKKLSLEEDARTKSILITEVNGMTLGVIVGHINEVISFEKDQLQTKDGSSKSQLSNEYIESIAKPGNNKLIIILDIPKIFTTKELDVPQRD